MSTITTRANKGVPLTHDEVDANFNNINNDLIVAESNITTIQADVTNLRRIESNTTIHVAASGGDYTTVGAAYDSLNNAYIEGGVTVTISVAAGTYVESTIVLDHPQGQSINITGAGSGTTTLSFSADADHGLQVLNGSHGGVISALTILSTSTTKVGVRVLDGSFVIANSDVVVDGWGTGVHVTQSARAIIDNITIDDTTTNGMLVDNGSTVNANAVTITQTSVNGGNGINADNGSRIYAQGASVQGASRTGTCVRAFSGSYIEINNADIDDGANCINAGRGSAIDAQGANIDGASGSNCIAGDHSLLYLQSTTNTNAGAYGIQIQRSCHARANSATMSGNTLGDYSPAVGADGNDNSRITT